MLCVCWLLCVVVVVKCGGVPMWLVVSVVCLLCAVLMCVIVYVLCVLLGWCWVVGVLCVVLCDVAHVVRLV